MSDILVARRYAQALYEEAKRKDAVEQVDADVEAIRESLEGSAELRRLFGNPVVSRDKKEAVVRALFSERLHAVTLHFLQLLVRKGRDGVFPTIAQAYQDLRDKQEGVVEARARVAQPMEEGDEQTLVTALEQLTGQRIRLSVSHDPALIGGVVVRVGDTVYDGSVRHKLATLRDQMEHGAFLSN